MHNEVKSIQKEVGGIEINIMGESTCFEEEDISPSGSIEEKIWVGVEADMLIGKQPESRSLPCSQV